MTRVLALFLIMLIAVAAMRPGHHASASDPGPGTPVAGHGAHGAPGTHDAGPVTAGSRTDGNRQHAPSDHGAPHAACAVTGHPCAGFLLSLSGATLAPADARAVWLSPPDALVSGLAPEASTPPPRA